MRSFIATTTPLHHLLPSTPDRRPRSTTYDGSASPRKRARSAQLLHHPLLPPPPDDVAELRRRIASRSASLDGFELCPYTQTPGAMLLAVSVAADDADPASATRAVRWLMRAGNQHWFECALRTAMCEPGRHVGLLRGLLADAAQFWPAHQVVVGSSSSSSGKSGKKKKGDGSPATRGVLRFLRAHSAAARKRAAVWGPFSADFMDNTCGVHSEDDEAEEEACGGVFCGSCRDDHSPALLMIDALLHGNLAAAQMVAETFTPSAWRIAGRWTVGNSSSNSNKKKGGEGSDDEADSFVPTSAIRLSASIVVRASARVPAASRAELEEKVRQCMRAAQETWMPELVEGE